MTNVAEPRPEPSPFGDCPECGSNDGYLNVGRDHWFVCDQHKTRWWAGGNLFSPWHDEDEQAWQENAKRLVSYADVHPCIRTSAQEPVEEPPKPHRIPAKDCIEGDTLRRGGDLILIRVEHHPDFEYLHEDCVFCGSTSSKRDAVAIAELPTGPAEVCHECIAAGTEGIKDRMRAHARRLRAWATEFERWTQSDIQAPSLEEVKETGRLGAIDSYPEFEEEPW